MITDLSGFKAYKRLILDAKQYWYLFVIGAIGTVVLSSVDAGLTWFLKPILDKGFINRDQSFINWLPLIILAIFVFRGVGGFVSRLLHQSCRTQCSH